MRAWRLLLIGTAITAVAIAVLASALLHTDSASANPLGGIFSIAAGEDHTCAIMDTGGVKCWGAEGRLGNGSSLGFLSWQPFPTDTADLTESAVVLGAGYRHTCAVLQSGSVRCWGDNGWGQLGVPDRGTGTVPVVATVLSGQATAVTGGDGHTCALLTTGSVQCWGETPDSATCGIYNHCDATSRTMTGITNAIDVAAGAEHTCAALSTGSVMCWGANRFGQLGDGSGTERTAPVQVLDMNNAVRVAAGAGMTCALTSTGSVRCWGQGYGNRAVLVPGLDAGVSAIGASQSHACALMASGGVKCWGDNGFGQLGDGKRCGNTCWTPVDVLGLDSGVRQIAAGVYHSCAVMDTGRAKCWGMNHTGQLGNGTLTDNWTATDVAAAEIKPPPTATPCAPEGCPTATPRPAPPQTGLDFSISIDTDGNGIPDCDTAEDARTECFLSPGNRFRVRVSLNALPPDVSEYVGFDLYLKYAGVSSERKNDIIWPDCGFPAGFSGPDFEASGCALPTGVRSSSFIGPIGESLYSCTRSGTVTLVHDVGRTDLVLTDLTQRYEQAAGEQLVINCGEEPRAGDVDCSQITNATDAALMLQSDAELLDWLSCPQFGDVNLDDDSDAIDSLLTLQYTAGLIGGLPVFPAQ